MPYFKIVCREDEKSFKIEQELRSKLKKLDLFDQKEDLLFVFVIGGDGTMIRAVHENLFDLDKAYFVGINTGTLGFYSNFNVSDIDFMLDLIKLNNYKYFKLPLIETEVDDRSIFYSLNEFRIENPFSTQIIKCEIDDDLFEIYRGSGLCICTPSGSTGYNKSLGGSVMMPNLEAFQLTEIAGLSNNKYRSLKSSLIISKNHNLYLTLTANPNIILSSDYNLIELKEYAKIKIKIADKYVKLITFDNLSFIDKIRKSFIMDN